MTISSFGHRVRADAYVSLRARLLAASLLAGTTSLGLYAGASSAFAEDASAFRLPVFLEEPFGVRAYSAPALGLSGHFYARADAAGPSSLPASFETDEYHWSWFLGKIHAAEAYVQGFTGKGVLVGVIDTGLDIDHPEFAGRISPLLRSFAANEPPGFMSDLEEDGQIAGHGTHVAGIIGAARNGVGTQGVAYNATILPLRAVEVATERDQDDPTLSALYYAAANGARVVNGSYGPDPLPPRWIPNPASPGNYIANPYHRVMADKLLVGPTLQAEHDAVKAAADADIVLIFSAGNAYQDQPIAASSPDGIGFFPYIRPGNTQAGAYKFITDGENPNDPSTYVYANPADPKYANLDFSDLQGTLIAIVATDRNNRISSYSNRCGVTFLWCLAAPGGDHALLGQSKEDYEILSTYPYSTYAPMVGTSMAAPVAAGAAAVLREAFPYMTARQIIEVMLTTTDNIGPKEIYGRGLLNLGRAVKGPKQFGAEGFAPVFDVNTKGHDSVWSNDIVGTGGLVKRGSGNLVLTGSNSYAGGTDVLGGVLTLTGSVSSSMAVGPAGTLRGTGVIGAPLTLAGTLEPGGSASGTFGTLTVTGNATLLSSSTYRVDANDRGAHDRLVVGGATSLAGGALDVELVDGLAPVGMPIEIVSSAGGATGVFGSLRTNSVSAFLDPRLRYSGTSVTVSFERNGVPFADAETSPDSKDVAAAIEALGQGSVLDDAIMRLDAASADRAFDALSGEAHASMATAAYGDARLIQATLLARLRQPLTAARLPLLAHGTYAATYAADRPGAAAAPVAVTPVPVQPRYALWGEGFGSWGKVRSNQHAAPLDISTGGFVLGADAEVGGGLRLGAAGGFTRTVFDVDARLSSGSSESVFAALYGSGQWGGINVRLGGSYARHDLDLSRTISFPGYGDATTASYNGATVQGFGEIGYRIGLGQAALEPFVGASVLRLDTERFQENGGPAALTGFGRRYDLGTTTVGVRAEARLSEELPLRLRGLLGWRHAFGDVEPEALLAFAGGTTAFTVAGVPVDRDALVAEAGFDWQASDTISLGVSYSGQIGSRTQDHTLKGSFVWTFDTR